jgi:outer membrane protein assembly factor BamB
MTIPTPVHNGDYLFFTSEFGGAHMLKLDQTKPGATVLWHGAGEQDRDFPSPDSIHSVISTPVLDGGYIYGIEALAGTLRCLDAATGKQVWESPKIFGEPVMHGTGFFVRNGDRYFINTDKGELIIAKLSPQGYEEISRAKLIEPTNPHHRRRGQPFVAWSHPAYANKHIVVRNDNEIIRISLAKEDN